jgi:hypothetical protein
MRLQILAMRTEPVPQPGRGPLVLGQLPIGLQRAVAVFENGVCIGVVIWTGRPRSPGIREPPKAAEGERLAPLQATGTALQAWRLELFFASDRKSLKTVKLRGNVAQIASGDRVLLMAI